MNNKIINKLKEETNNSSYIIYREKYINNTKINIIYNESLTDQDKMSNFIYRSLDHIDKIYNNQDLLYDVIKNNISNIKIKEIKNYKDINKYLNNGFAILLIENDYSLALEVKKNLTRSIEKPMTETTIRGPMDSFTENIETNMGLIKRRIKSNKLWNHDIELGKYSKNKISILTIDGITDTTIKNNIIKKLNNRKIKLTFFNKIFLKVKPNLFFLIFIRTTNNKLLINKKIKTLGDTLKNMAYIIINNVAVCKYIIFSLTKNVLTNSTSWNNDKIIELSFLLKLFSGSDRNWLIILLFKFVLIS